MARIYGAVLTTGGTVQHILEWPERLEKVTPEDVMTVARTYFDLNRSVTGILKPVGDI